MTDVITGIVLLALALAGDFDDPAARAKMLAQALKARVPASKALQ
jgi:hypothetical protein